MKFDAQKRVHFTTTKFNYDFLPKKEIHYLIIILVGSQHVCMCWRTANVWPSSQ